jgi:hypothetical protein
MNSFFCWRPLAASGTKAHLVCPFAARRLQMQITDLKAAL